VKKVDLIDPFNDLLDRRRRAQAFMDDPHISTQKKQGMMGPFKELCREYEYFYTQLWFHSFDLAVRDGVGRITPFPQALHVEAGRDEQGKVVWAPVLFDGEVVILPQEGHQTRKRLGYITKEMARPDQGSAGKACSVCGKERWWQKKDGQQVCGVCHPDPREKSRSSENS